MFYKIDNILISIKWALTRLLKRCLVVFFCSVMFPILLFSLALELLSDFLLMLHKLLEYFFSCMHDGSKAIFITVFQIVGFHCGRISLGDRYTQKNINNIKKIAKENGIKFYIIEELVREGDEFFIKIIVPRETDLNLLKLLINATPKDKTVF